MSIIQFLQLESHIFAINSKGQLVIWDLAANRSANGSFLFQNNISLVPSRIAFAVDSDGLLQMNSYGKTIAMNNTQKIYITTVNHILHQLSHSNHHLQQITIITASSFLDKQQLINSTIIINASQLLIGTNRGNVYCYNFSLGTMIRKVNLNNNPKLQNAELSYMQNIKKNAQVTSLSHHFTDGLILVGLSNGKLLTFSLQLFQGINQYQTKNKVNLEPINKIILSKSQDRIYCLHQSYITQWSSKLNSCTSYIEYNNPRDLLVMNQSLYIVGNHHKFVWVDSFGSHEVELSMRSARVIKQISEKMIGVGGSQGTIDVFVSAIRLMTLFTK